MATVFSPRMLKILGGLNDNGQLALVSVCKVLNSSRIWCISVIGNSLSFRHDQDRVRQRACNWLKHVILKPVTKNSQFSCALISLFKAKFCASFPDNGISEYK